MENKNRAGEIVGRLNSKALIPEQETRTYIGASIVGHPCNNFYALSLRGFPSNDLDWRLYRIFRDGHYIERRAIEDLRSAGFFVEDVDPATGKQWQFKHHTGHVMCNVDGIIEISGEHLILEVKSMNRASFFSFSNYGVKKAHEKYYDQMQLAMELSGLKRAMILAYNKDTAEYAVDIVNYDLSKVTFLTARINNVMKHGSGKRIALKPDARWCAGCLKSNACWSPETVPASSCSRCKHAVPITNGWYCNIHNQPATSVCNLFEVYRAAS